MNILIFLTSNMSNADGFWTFKVDPMHCFIINIGDTTSEINILLALEFS